MVFITKTPDITFSKPAFCGILANTLLSTVPGVSGAGPTAEKTLLTPILDAELIVNGYISSMPLKPNTPSGCPTPASITRAMMELTGVTPVFINAGLYYPPTVPVLEAGGHAGNDPRHGDAVPQASELFTQGERIGKSLSTCSDMLVLGECVPGGTTTALCVLRALGRHARVSSSFVNNPIGLKEEICIDALKRFPLHHVIDPLQIIRMTGDPMMPVAAGIAHTYQGKLVLAGGTQMLAVCGIIKALNYDLPLVVTTVYVRDDTSANVPSLAEELSVDIIYIDPGFEDLGHSGLARYCIGEVKEGMGAGGAMFLAYLMGYTPEVIRKKIFEIIHVYS